MRGCRTRILKGRAYHVIFQELSRLAMYLFWRGPVQMGWAPLEAARDLDPACMKMLLATSCGPAAGLAAAAACGDVAAMRGLLAEGAPPDGPPNDGVGALAWSVCRVSTRARAHTRKCTQFAEYFGLGETALRATPSYRRTFASACTAMHTHGKGPGEAISCSHGLEHVLVERKYSADRICRLPDECARGLRRSGAGRRCSGRPRAGTTAPFRCSWSDALRSTPVRRWAPVPERRRGAELGPAPDSQMRLKWVVRFAAGRFCVKRLSARLLLENGWLTLMKWICKRELAQGGETALHFAALNGHATAARLLLEAGASADATNMVPLQLAPSERQGVRQLLRYDCHALFPSPVTGITGGRVSPCTAPCLNPWNGGVQITRPCSPPPTHPTERLEYVREVCFPRELSTSPCAKGG